MRKGIISIVYGIILYGFGSIQAQDTIHMAEKPLKKQDTVLVSPVLKDTVRQTVAPIQSTKRFEPALQKALSDTALVATDSLRVYIQKDQPELMKIDSLWAKELYATNDYDALITITQNLDYESDYTAISTEVLKARLAELDAKTPFKVVYNTSLESVINTFLKTRHEHLQRLMGLSAYYFPLFEQELDNYDVPLEVKYLAVIESALRPRAKSRVGAAGIWQFMFGTGKMYGLDVSSYVDERMDPIRSTKAAAKYLAKLYKMFKDWDLALASYNSGPGNVSKAIRRSGGYTNYWDIRRHLPRETAGYLPAFLATMYIFEYASEHGFDKSRPAYAYYETDTIQVKKMIKLDQVSQLLDVDIEELRFLNPCYKLDIIPFVEKERYTLRLPRGKVGNFVTHEDKIYNYAHAKLAKEKTKIPEMVQAKNKIRYRVKSGDVLGSIAARHGVRVSQLKQWNGLRGNTINIDQRLTIYPRNPALPKSTIATKSKEKRAVNNNTNSYTVRNGDNLWTIAKKINGVSAKNLQDWNNLSSSALKPGMRLRTKKP